MFKGVKIKKKKEKEKMTQFLFMIIICVITFILFAVYVSSSSSDRRRWGEIKEIKEIKKRRKKKENVNVYIYLLCFNEEYLIEKTILHYKKRFPGAVITIMDNYSTDRSVSIAKEYGCTIHYWENPREKGKISEHMYRHLKNNIWKERLFNRDEEENSWIIACDMDEWLEIDETDLLFEEKNGHQFIQSKSRLS